jgi:hypothetical protein
MHLSEMVAYVTLIVADAERRFGADHYSALHDAYAREATLGLWLTRPGFTVSLANDLLSWTRIELGRRAIARHAFVAD